MIIINTYIYWLFYEKSNGELYAYTDSKKLYKQFKEERDMSKFTSKKFKLTKEEIHNITNDFGELYLKKVKLKTRNNQNKIKEIEMVLSKIEYDSVLNVEYDLLLCGIYTYCWVPASIFKISILLALKELGYHDVYKHMTNNLNYVDKPEFIKDADELGIFLRHYGDTLILEEKTK